MSSDEPLYDDDTTRRSDEEGDQPADRPRRKARAQASKSSSSAVWWILGGAGVVFLLCGGCCGGFAWLGYYSVDMVKTSNKAEVDGLHTQSLYGGDATAVYQNADPAFRKVYSRQEWDKFIANKPGMLDRDNLWGGMLQHRTIGKDRYVVLVSKPGGMADPGVAIVLKMDKEGSTRLVGISPGLDREVPSALHFDPNNPNAGGGGGGGGGRGFDD